MQLLGEHLITEQDSARLSQKQISCAAGMQHRELPAPSIRAHRARRGNSSQGTKLAQGEQGKMGMNKHKMVIKQVPTHERSLPG